MSAAVIPHPAPAAAPVANARWYGRYPAQVVLLRRVRARVERARTEAACCTELPPLDVLAELDKLLRWRRMLEGNVLELDARIAQLTGGRP